MRRYNPVGWRNESYRHSLASRGISTRLARLSFADKPLIPVVRNPAGKLVPYGAVPYAYNEGEVENMLRDAGVTDPVQVEEYKQVAKTMLEEEELALGQDVRYMTSGRKPKGMRTIGKTIPSTEAAVSWEEYEFMDSSDKQQVMADVWIRNKDELRSQGYRDLSDFIRNSSDMKKKDYIMKAFYEDTSKSENLQKNILQRGAVLNLIEDEYVPSLPSQSESSLKIRMDNAQAELDSITQKSIRDGYLSVGDEDRLAELAKVLSPSSMNRLRAIDHMKGLRLLKNLRAKELQNALVGGQYSEEQYNQAVEELNDNVKQLLIEDAEILKRSNVESEKFKEGALDYINAYTKGGALELTQKRLGGYLSVMKRAEPGVSQQAYNNALAELKSVSRYLTDEQKNNFILKLQMSKELLDRQTVGAQRAEADLDKKQAVGSRKPSIGKYVTIGKIKLPAGATMATLTPDQKKVVDEVVKMQIEKYKKMLGGRK